VDFFKIKSSLNNIKFLNIFYIYKRFLNIDQKIYQTRSLKDRLKRLEHKRRLKRLEQNRMQTLKDPYILQRRVYFRIWIWFATADSEAITCQSSATFFNAKNSTSKIGSWLCVSMSLVPFGLIFNIIYFVFNSCY